MKLYPTRNKCGCDADKTAETAVQTVRRGDWDGTTVNWYTTRAKQVFHYRERDQAHFWHWSDQEVVKI